MICTNISKTATRLKKVEGQIRGIIKMVEDEKACADILIQISAARSALHKAGQKLLENHLKFCLEKAHKENNLTSTIEELKKAIDQFAKIS